MNILLITISVLLWGGVHSWLASERAKATVHQRLGATGDRLYRLAFNVFAGLSLLPILILTRLLPDRALYSVPAPWLYLMGAGQVAALGCLVLALMQTDALEFIGLRQIVDEGSKPELKTHGFYGLVRHPLYLFGLAILWLTPIMTLNTFVLFVLLSIYLFVGASFEERRLSREFGQEYEEYCRRTPMIIPGLRVPRAGGAGTEGTRTE